MSTEPGESCEAICCDIWRHSIEKMRFSQCYSLTRNGRWLPLPSRRSRFIISFASYDHNMMIMNC
jgi:hypothetical protein